MLYDKYKIKIFFIYFSKGITSKRRGLVGRYPGNLIWVFGMWSRSQKILKVFLVPNRRSATLFPLIRENISNGSIILSDEFSVYITSRTQVSRFNILMNFYFIFNKLSPNTALIINNFFKN